jgi:hypothetical protein
MSKLVKKDGFFPLELIPSIILHLSNPPLAPSSFSNSNQFADYSRRSNQKFTFSLYPLIFVSKAWNGRINITPSIFIFLYV